MRFITPFASRILCAAACALLCLGAAALRPAHAQSTDGAADDAATAPLPSADGALLQPATFTYRIEMNMMGQEMTMEGTRTIAAATADGRALWRLVDGGDSPWGTYADTVEVDRQTLLPVRQRAAGSGDVTLHYSPEAVTGEVAMGQNVMPVNAPLAAPTFGSEAGLELALAGLPLAAGYQTHLRSFHPYSQQARPMRLAVTGTESITVPAGTFEALVVEMAPLEGSEQSVLHVLPSAPHYVIQGAYTLPEAMGGGSITVTMLSKNDG